MEYPLARLIRARKLREDAAVRAAAQARARHEKAVELVERRRRELDEYRDWRPQEERRLFESVRGLSLSRGELDGHLGDIQSLRAEEARRGEAVHEAEKAAEECARAEEAARRTQLAAMRARQKLDEHRQRWQIEEDKRLEAAEEKELEDFVKHGAEDRH